MRICVIGKFPPIQGGVSTRTYWSAHDLAARGHEVHVVTNAKEVRPPFRMHMRAEDWDRCEATYGPGSVSVHWTDPVDSSQSFIPMASPFVSKLAAIATRVHSERPFDAIYSHYMEPYGVAGHLAAQASGVPHVVRMAGSDAGRLWHHPQFETLYDHVLRSARVVIAAGAVAERAIQRGVDPGRIARGPGFLVPQHVFTPSGPALDLAALRTELELDPDLRELLWGDFPADRPYFGVYGKLGERKGSFALLAAMHRLKHAGLDVGLVALAHGQARVQSSFRERARQLGLTEHILQIPFLPHWRVPEFLRSCLAICCLEQDFPIAIHTPIIALEVLLCGACLVASTEVIRKLPGYGKLPHGYGCVAVEDVNNIEALSEHLAAILKDPGPAAEVGARGCAFARELQRDLRSPQILEHILKSAVAPQEGLPTMRGPDNGAASEPGDGRFPFTQLAEAALAECGENCGAGELPVGPRRPVDLARAREVLAAIDRGGVDGNSNASLRSLAPVVRLEIAIAEAEAKSDEADAAEYADPLFRLRMRRWAMEGGDLPRLVPVRDPQLRVVRIEYDVSEFLGVRNAAAFPDSPTPRPNYIVTFGRSDGRARDPLLVDALTARILELSDGTRTAAQIVEELRELHHEGGTSAVDDDLRWIEDLFRRGLVRLQDARIDPTIHELN